MIFCFRTSGLLIVLTLLLSMVSPVQAERTDFLFSKKFHGLLALSASGIFLREAYQSRTDGNYQYQEYELTENSQRARELYDESKRNDTRSLVFLGIGVASLFYSLHLFISKEDKLPLPEMENKGFLELKGVSLDVTSSLKEQRMQLGILKKF